MATITHTTEIITPELAQEYLGTSLGNRKIRQKDVDAIARNILAGTFLVTHQGIAFDETGHLLDGHHRLLAVVKANVPIQIDVARGVPRESVVVIDTMNVRTFSDALYYNSDIFEDDPALRNKAIHATIRALVNCEYNNSFALSNEELLYLLYQLKDECKLVYETAVCRTTGFATSPMKAAALAAIMCGLDGGVIYSFFSIICNGDDSNSSGKNATIVWNWKNQILNAKAHHKSMTRYALYKGTQNAIWHYSAGTNVRANKIPTDSRYPVKAKIESLLEKYKNGAMLR